MLSRRGPLVDASIQGEMGGLQRNLVLTTPVYNGDSGWPSRKMLLQKTGLATQIPFFWGMSWSLLREGVVTPRACAAEGVRKRRFRFVFCFWRVFIVLFKMALCRLWFFYVRHMFWDTLYISFFYDYYDYFSCLNLMYPCVLCKTWNSLHADVCEKIYIWCT